MLGQTQFQLFYFPNNFPSDNLQDLFRRLRKRSKIQDNPALRAFVVNATAALREEIRQLPDSLRSLLPPLDNALDLAELRNWQRGPLSGALEGVLLTLFSIASLIGHYERNPDQFRFSKSTTCFTGLGIGLLAAAAVVASPTLADLPKIGAEAVRIAFRMGVLVDEISQSIEAREAGSPSDSWAAVVMNVNEATMQKELDSFNTSTNCPIPSKLFISAGGEGDITISGPPSKLRKIFRVSETLRSSRYAQLPVYGGLCHAPHIYSTSHPALILEGTKPAIVDRVILDMASLLSTGTGAPFQGATPRQLFESVIFELLTGTIRWNLAVNSALSLIPASSTTCNVYTFRSNGVVTGLTAHGKEKAPERQFQTYDLVDWLFQDGEDTPLNIEDSKIAIVGMSCRFPGGANDLDLFWELLEEGRDVHQKVPADRYNVETHTDASGKSKNTSLTPFGCFIDQPGLFDAGFFNMSPREAAQTDPMHRLALITAYEALEQSGFVANRTESSDRRGVGTFYGQSCDDYREANAGQTVDTYYIPGGCRAFAPGRINYFFKFTGPSFDCDTACSSSLATIQLACTSLLHGDTNTIVAGGLNVLTNSDGFAGLSRGHFLSKTGGCKTFDCNADGYCRADGIGSVVMKRLEDAQRDNDNILGVILASATNHSADAVSITHPHAPTQADLYRHVMNYAAVSPLDVDFIEMHGTGTQAGDATEMESITSVFSPQSPIRTRPLYIGSVKANIGHGEAAAGVMALMKVLLALQRNAIPKHVGIQSALNPKFPDLNRLNVHIPYDNVPWLRSSDPTRKRYAVVNNFSAAGGNTTVLLEEPPLRTAPEADPRTAFVVAVSAKSKFSLKKNLQSLLAYLDENPSVNLAHLSYTTTARRMHHNHRIAIHGNSQEIVIQRLKGHLSMVETQRPISTPSIGFVFSGQGCFYIGIGRQLYESHPGFQLKISRLHAICISHGFPSFLEAIVGSPAEPGAEITPIITQLTIVCVSIALCQLWESIGVKPSVAIGASLGEFAALYAAGVLSASDAIYLVGQRALLLQKLCTADTHAMLAVRATMDQIRKALTDQAYEVACVNGVSDITLSGSVEEIRRMQSTVEAHGYKSTRLDVPFAFHSVQVDPLLDSYEKIAGGVTFKEPNIPVVSPLLADCIFDDKTINASYMRNATRHSVQFVEALQAARDMGLVDEKTVWVEIGPHASYSKFVQKATSESTPTIASLKRDEDNWYTFAHGMAQLHNLGVDLDWQAWHAPFEARCLRLLDLPSYQWNMKNYWIQYNGEWMLTKDEKVSTPVNCASSVPPSLRNALIHQLLEESIEGHRGEVVIQSDILQPDFFEAMHGHKMNGCAVATSSIHAEVAFTLAKYLHSRSKPHVAIEATGIDVKNMEVAQGLIARKGRSQPQWIQIRAQADFTVGSVQLSWHHVDDRGKRVEEPFARAVAQYGQPERWLDEWLPMTHLITSRIDVLKRLSDEGKANSLSQDMVYMLFNNLVDYAEKYRGMQTVILHDMEAMANVTLAPEQSDKGKWTVAPHYIDSVAHLAGFILNGGNALDPRRNFYVTPGWKSMRFARPLVSGGRYVCYVKMLPIKEQPGFYEGDVYVLQDDQIVGMVRGITFRTFPRLLLDKFFSPPDAKAEWSQEMAHVNRTAPVPVPKAQVYQATPSDTSADSSLATQPLTPEFSAAVSPTVHRALALIAQETEVSISELSDEMELSSIGIDSLLALVLAEKFQAELQLEVRSSLFLDCVTLGDFKSWLADYC